MAIVKTSRNERAQGLSSLLARQNSMLIDRVAGSFSLAYKCASLQQIDYIDEDIGGSDFDMANAEAILDKFLLDDFPLILNDEISNPLNPPEDSPSSTSMSTHSSSINTSLNDVHFAHNPAAEGQSQCNPVILCLDDEEMLNEDVIDTAICDAPALTDGREFPGWNPIILSLNGATGTPLAHSSLAPILDEEMANEDMLKAPVACDPPARTLKELPECYPVISPVACDPPALILGEATLNKEELDVPGVRDLPHLITGELPAWSPVILPINDNACVTHNPSASILRELPGWAPDISPINYGAGVPVNCDLPAPILDEDMANRHELQELPGWSPTTLSANDNVTCNLPHSIAGKLPGWSAGMLVARDPPAPIVDKVMSLADELKVPVACVPPTKLSWNWDVDPPNNHVSCQHHNLVPAIESPILLPDTCTDGRFAPMMPLGENPQIFGIFATPFMPGDFHTAPKKPATYAHVASKEHDPPPPHRKTIKFTDD
ncbi:hypothetical protein BDN71DRAFT_1505924 [Pleurotus eryngii]|uniref:Uncharacterized protein n=1 Tax=Pleurotus eryngii TaxID=5323 RepID=A0A9P6DHB2_PLEER|nr:hypothetical protein BDN71DRAFT_1505924 [Pleurotus eryngii]